MVGSQMVADQIQSSQQVIHWDPRRHPRNRVGEFSRVLSRIEPGLNFGGVIAVNLPGGVQVTKTAFGGHFKVTDANGRHRKVKTPGAAAKVALRGFDGEDIGAIPLEEAPVGPRPFVAPPDPVAQARAQVKTRGGKRGRAGATRAPKTRSGGQANTGFEAAHPRGRGGLWIKKGDGLTGEPNPQVKQLQNRLKHIGYGVKPDGRFGDKTEAAVKRFQGDKGLAQDGIVGDKTTAALKGHEAGGTDSSYGDKYRGAGGAAARARQNKELTGKASLTPGSSSAGGSSRASKGHSSRSKGGSAGSRRGSARQAGGVPGLDPGNPHSIEDFQRRHGLKVDGVIGPQTERAIRHEEHASRASGAKGRGSQGRSGGSRGSATPGHLKNGSLTIGAGIKGAPDKQVKGLQQQLDDLGYDLGDAGVDGRFGPDTAAAVRHLQRRYGLPVTGVIDRHTMSVLNRADKRLHSSHAKGEAVSADQETVSGMQQAVDAAVEERQRLLIEGDTRGYLRAIERERALRKRLEEHSSVTRQIALGLIDPMAPPPAAPPSAAGDATGYITGIMDDGRTMAEILGLDKREVDEAEWAASLAYEAGVLLENKAGTSLSKASSPEPFSSSRTSNWVARAGGLPAYIQHIAHDLMEKRGKSEQNAIQMAVGIVKRWAKGVGNVTADTRAAAAKAVAEWEAKKAASHASAADDSELIGHLLQEGVDLLAEAKLKAKERAKLPDTAFAIPESRSYPIHDENHARAALSMVAKHGSEDEKKKVRAAVKRRHPKVVQEAEVEEAKGEAPGNMKIKCPKCGAMNRVGGSKKCRNCGHYLGDAIKAKMAKVEEASAEAWLEGKTTPQLQAIAHDYRRSPADREAARRRLLA